ncbi:AFG1 family ATPase [Aliiroseovarius crassostreae]|uniref:AFG1 family ATPase n=1 Tax=Aliiroseovarius crassostreae TaxID=154981 RepID=A0A9Q9LYX3_9RHOB|nr:cell division protein ZapE [Aliiroseovarius crassostreae]UWP91762.1 AFG1 family ATPase [Aliiroseovarius crassostreae]UWP94908.1 AFG1 family ATPase [Aliiroseovarius crassostreae]UWP98070.1 AFG1 family ATPase [Aliiroseovarius crassostreae]
MTSLIEIYSELARKGDITPDPAQEAVLPALEDVRAHLEAAPTRKRGILGGLFHKPVEVPQGLYLWGGVGRGKSMLMDLFVENLNIPAKRRVHFHAFMQEVHEGLNAARKTGVDDPLGPVADKIAADVRLFAFDEMQITDITDAMIVGRLFEKLFDAGVVVVTTSNRHPDELYKDGLNRQLFLPFIQLIKDQMVVHELVSPNDYRQDRLAGGQVYFSPANAAARTEMNAIWQDMTGGHSEPLTLSVKGRDVVIPAYRNGAGRAGFHDLCGAMLGPGDYLVIADALKVLVLDNIPRLSRSNFNEAKRFVTLIDALYEAKVRLIASAAALPEMLYVEGEGSFEFERTASRLREMQDKDWGS